MSAHSDPGHSITPEASGHPRSVANLSATLVERLHAKAHAEKWQLSAAAGGPFSEALERSIEHHCSKLSAAPDSHEAEAYLNSLHLEDLALACACAEGNEAAWEHFVCDFRPVLYAAARAIAGESAARELADSLYAELFGVSETGKERKSLFRYFHGRSKLSTWLRAVLAQRHVDALRAARRNHWTRRGNAEAKAILAIAASMYGSPPRRTPVPYQPHLIPSASAISRCSRPRLRRRLPRSRRATVCGFPIITCRT